MPARLLQLLVKKGLLPVERGPEALRIQTMTGGSLDTVLLELGWLGEQDILAALGEVSSYRSVNLADFEPNFEVAPLIPPKIADRLCVAPLSTDGPTLHVACGYPVKKAELDEVAFLLGKQLELWVGIEARIREWIASIYRLPLGARYAALLANIDPSRPAPALVAAAARPAGSDAEPVTSPGLSEPTTNPGAPDLDLEPPTPVEDLAPQHAAPGGDRKPPERRPSGTIAAQKPPQQPSSPPAAAQKPPPQQPPAPPSKPASGRSPSQGLIEERTLEDALTAEMVDRLAQAVADEPIPLEVRKAPRPTRFQPELPAVDESAPGRFAAPAEVVSFDRRLPITRPDMPAVPSPPAPPPATRPPAPLQLGPPVARESVPLGRPAHPPDPGDFQIEEYDTNPGRPRVMPPAPPPATPSPVLIPYVPPPYVPPPHATPLPMPSDPVPEPPPPPARPPAPEPPRVQLALPALPPPPDQTVPEWSLQEARGQLKEATVERDRIIEVALRYGRRTFDLVVAFAVIRGSAVGWDVRGEGLEAPQISQVSIPLDSASVFRTVALSRGSYVGPLPPDSLSKHFLELFGRAPRQVFLFPVEVRSRLVAIIYGDSGTKPLSQRKLSDFILFCQDLPGAFQELLVKRKQRAGASLAAAEVEPLTPDGDIVADVVPDVIAPTPVPKGLGWSPFASVTTSRPGRAAGAPGPIIAERERPPPDFAPLLRRLTGPDATERARAVAELARTPEASSRVLAEKFPGPTAWSRLPLMELPEPDELGPIPGALARLGRPAAQALAPLLDADDPDTRYFALLTAGNLPYPELVDGVLRGLFDLEPDISSAARAASTALKRVTRFETAMKDLRQELTSIDALRRSLAARALGVLHDREAIDGLINLTGSDDQMCASAAAEALRDITKATFGTSPRQWTRWWAENRSRRRVEWLVTGLRHSELEIRIAAIEELARAVNDNLGFSPDGEPPDREAAARRWEALINQRGRWERWDL